MSVLLVADHDNAALSAGNAKAMSAAKAIGGNVHVLVAGADAKAVAEAATKLDGVAKVLQHANAIDRAGRAGDGDDDAFSINSQIANPKSQVPATTNHQPPTTNQ